MQDRDADELAILFRKVRRFFACWSVLLVSLAIAAVLLGVLLELVILAASAFGGVVGDLDGQALVLSGFWAYSAVWAGLVLGAPVVLLRRHIVRPDPPFLRAGYLGIAAAPFILAVAGQGESDWYVLPAYVEAALLLAALIYVVLARRLRLFDPEEWRADRV